MTYYALKQDRQLPVLMSLSTFVCVAGTDYQGNQGRLLFKAMKAQYSMQNPVNLFMDAPPNVDLQDLVNQSYDKTFWKSLEAYIPSHLRGVTIYTE